MNTLTISPIASGHCRGRHCAHDQHCSGPKPNTGPVPWSRGLRYCTCPPTWHAIIPPPPCPVHGEMQMLTVTCGTASASIPAAGDEPRYYYATVGPAL